MNTYFVSQIAGTKNAVIFNSKLTLLNFYVVKFGIPKLKFLVKYHYDLFPSMTYM